MTDILTPSECARLVAIEAEMTKGPWHADKNRGCKEIHSGKVRKQASWNTMDVAYTSGMADEAADEANAIGIVELRNNAKRMLATITELRKQLEERK